MGIASKLFYSSNTAEESLYSRIVPSDNHEESQKERWNDLCEYLIGNLNESTGLTISSWLQGSYKFKTQIRPPKKGEEFDIDLGIYFNSTGGTDTIGYDPLELKSIVQKSLEDYKTEVGEEIIEVVAPPKKRCCRIRFTGGFHIDIPVYYLDSTNDSPYLATEDNKWEESDPKALYQWFLNQALTDEHGAQIRRIIRYFKMWAALKFSDSDRPSTIMLTVLIAEALDNVCTPNVVQEEDTLFSLCVKEIIERLINNNAVLNPVNSSENLNRLNESSFNLFLEELNKLNDICDKAIVSESEIEAAAFWQESFEYFFPFPSNNETRGVTTLVPINFDPSISIVAVPKNNAHNIYTGTNKIGPIPKDCKLTFKIMNAGSLPNGAKAQWIARNVGDEAEYKNDFGHKVEGEGFIIHDYSAYRGIHFMDVVIKSAYDVVLGYKRIPVDITGIAMPPRNPKKKAGFRYKKR
jgi:hypothetical protein